MPSTSSFKINNRTGISNPEDAFESNYYDSTDLSPLIYPEKLLEDKTRGGVDKVVPFMGFYVLVPETARDNGSTLDKTSSIDMIKLRSLDYAQEVNQDLIKVESGASARDHANAIGALVGNAIAGKQKIQIMRKVNLLKKFVCLYMPDSINNDLNASYSSLSIGNDLVTAGSIVEGVKVLTDGVKNGFSADSSNKTKDAISSFLAQFSGSGGIEGAVGTAAKYYQAGRGIAINPMTELFFDNMNFRQFSFEFKFMPKSAKESATVLDIIKTFRAYMVPEINKESVVGLFVSAPAFFQIKYYIQESGNVRENEKIPKISGCVLTNMAVDNAPEGAAFHKDGMPVAIRMVLSFTELELMHRDRIMGGY